jgi:2-methylcitrate dehydratase
MTLSEELASFIVKASYDDLSSEAKTQLKIRVLDSLGCAIRAIEADVIKRLRQQTDDFGGREHCSLIGGGAVRLIGPHFTTAP